MAKCSACGNSIQGQYLKLGRQALHPQCFICKGCRRPIEGSYVERSGFWHGACATKQFAPQCKGCGQPIEGEVITAFKQNWHSHCFRCASCHAPIKERTFHTKDGKAFHKRCYEDKVLPRCAICEKPMQKHLIDTWGNRFCPSHRKKIPSCFSCQRIISDNITNGGIQYRDGRTLCNLCSPNVVDDQSKGEQLLDKARVIMESLGFQFGDNKIPFRLVSQSELNKYAKRGSRQRPVMGMARSSLTTQGKQIVDREFNEVIILQGLPEEHFLVVAVHELCHAWLFFSHFTNLPTKVEEGLCTLAEYLYLRTLDTHMARFRIKGINENKDPIYGDGYRAARKALSKRSLSDLLRYVHKNRRFPGGLFGMFG